MDTSFPGATLISGTRSKKRYLVIDVGWQQDSNGGMSHLKILQNDYYLQKNPSSGSLIKQMES